MTQKDLKPVGMPNTPSMSCETRNTDFKLESWDGIMV